MSDYIPEDILILIFKYLPVKTLLRFRCVSKHWKQIIDSPTLAQQHLSVQNPRFIVDPHRRKYLLVDPLPRPSIITLSKPIETKFYVLAGTLHGVVCLCGLSNLVIWNPSLRKFSSLPFPSGFSWYSGDGLQTCYGFWIEPSTKEFKALILQRKPDVKCILYSSIRDGWSVIPTEKLVNWRSCKEGPPVMVGGVAHWGGCLDEIMIDDNHLYEHEHKDKVILSFDFVQESFDFIEIPYLYYRESAPFRWQGTLSLLCWNNDFPCKCAVYSRREDSWVEMFDFEVYESILHAFWAMEDVEERKKKGKRKRKMELERVNDSDGEPQGNARVLATTVTNTSTLTSELGLYGTKTGSKSVRKELKDDNKVYMAYDFVESLLFP